MVSLLWHPVWLEAMYVSCTCLHAASKNVFTSTMYVVMLSRFTQSSSKYGLENAERVCE